MVLKINSSMLTPRVRQLPRGLIYNFDNEKKTLYRLFDTKSGDLVGRMLAIPETRRRENFYNLDNDEDLIFRIHSLEIEESQRNKGWGTYFMNYAKKESYRQNCKGRLSLIAYNPYKSPHIFYKKQGLVTADENLNKKLDRCIEDKDYTNFFRYSEMYLPIVEKEEKQKDFAKKKFWDIIKSIFDFKKD